MSNHANGKYPDTGATVSTRDILPLTHGFVTRLVELVETNVAYRLQEVIASVSVGLGAAPKRKGFQSTERSLSTAQPVRRVATVTPKIIQARKIQGQYMSAVRGLKPHDRNRVDKLTRAKGVVAGLALARSLGEGPKRTRNASRPRAIVRPGRNTGVTPNLTELIR